MRDPWFPALAVTTALSACASKPGPAPLSTAPTCRPLTSEQWNVPIGAAIQKTFDRDLTRRFGETGTHVLVERTRDEHGNFVAIARRIGPARLEMPETGKGGEVMIVLAPCTGKVLKVRKLADLEAHPLPRAPNEEEPGTQGMIRFARPTLAISALSALAATACATIPPAGPTHFYVSWSGVDPRTQPVFDIVDARMRADPAFLRDFNEPMHIHIADGAPAAYGRLRYRVRITIPSRLADRRISQGRTTLADFSVTCAPDHPQPCADEILEQTQPQPAKIRRIIARSPRA